MGRFEDMPKGGGVSPNWRSKIMHAQLNAGGAVLMGSDAPDDRYQPPQGFSVSLQLGDPAEADSVFKALSENGAVSLPIEEDCLGSSLRYARGPLRHSLDGESPKSGRCGHGAVLTDLKERNTRIFQYRRGRMSKVRVLVGTKKGAFVLSSDGKREKWDVSGPHFAGWEIYHLKGSPVDPESHLRLAAQRLVRPDHSALQRWRQDLGDARRRKKPGPEAMPRARATSSFTTASPETGKPLTTHQWYDGTQHPWEFKRVWHLEPSLTDPDTVYAGRRRRGALQIRPTAERPGTSFPDCAATAPDRKLAARRRRHVPAHHHSRSQQSRADLHRHLRRGRLSHRRRRQDLEAHQQGTALPVHSRPDAEVGHCVHHIAMHPSRPSVLFMQKHWDVMRSDDAGDSWHEVSGNLPTDFGFVIDVHAHEPETIYVVPIKSDWRTLSA